MKTAALLLLLTLVGRAEAEVVWHTDFAAAQRIARQAGRPLLVDFMAAWCGPCKEMERTTFPDAKVQQMLGQFVCARIDIDKNPAVAKRFGVRSIPRLIAVDSKGKRLLDVFGYRPAEALREELRSALRGRPVIQSENGEGTSPVEPPELAALRAQVQKGTYAAWRTQRPREAARARAMLVERLGAFEAEERDRAAALLAQLGDDAAETLIGALNHPQLAVRVAAHDGLTRLLASRYRIPVASQPRYDAWAAASERARAARAWRAWWAKQRGKPMRAL